MVAWAPRGRTPVIPVSGKGSGRISVAGLVLIDRDAVASGATTDSQPWQHYDLGHGYCNYTFFEQCQHRMACARCDFYTPKTSSAGQLLEAKKGLQRMLIGIPLTDDERAAVDNDHAAVDRLLQRLAHVATPAGPTPNELHAELRNQLPLTVLHAAGT